MEIRIGNRMIGDDNPCYTIAEAGANHDGNVEKALRLIDAAVAGKADSVKFQTYAAERLTTKTATKYWDDGKTDESQFDVFERLDTIQDNGWREIFAYAEKKGISCFSTPFDEESVELLYALSVPAFKIASADITHLPLIRCVASKGLPVFLSTGMATREEIDDAINTIEDCGNHEIILMHCMTSYPTKPKDANLNIIHMLKERYGEYVIGYSDHTLGTNIPICSITYGVKALEKHFTFDNSLKDSPDHRMSLNTNAFATMVDGIREAEVAGGLGERDHFTTEAVATKYARRSIVTTKKIPRGTLVTKDMLAIKRPGTGIYPKFLDFVVGETTTRDVEEDVPLQWKDIKHGFAD